MTEQLVDSSHHLYLPRSGESIEPYVEVLKQDPQYPLSEHQKEEVFRFRDTLSGDIEGDYHLDDTLLVALNGHDYATDKHDLPLGYLITSEGRELLAKHAVVGIEHEFGSTEEIGTYISAHAFGIEAKNAETFKKLTLEANKAQDSIFIDALVQKKEPLPAERLIIFTDGTELIRKLQGLVAYRKYFNQIKKDTQISEGQEGVVTLIDAAKFAYIDSYKRVVNAELAKMYPDVLALQEQSHKFEGEMGEQLRAGIKDALPVMGLLPRGYIHRALGSMMIRMDRVRNGASIENGRYTSISQELRDFLERADDSIEYDGAIFTKEEAKILDSINVGTEDIVLLASTLLTRLGKLSRYPADESCKKRGVRAPDDKWQIFVRDDISSMDAQLKRAVLVIPQIDPAVGRSLTKAPAPAGVVPVLGHELTHIFQEDNTRDQEGKGLGILVSSKRNSVYLEAGAIGTERILQERWFGRGRSDAPHYLRALDVLEKGGSEFSAIKASYDSYRAVNSNVSDKEAASNAVSRVKRLARRMGGFDSQPLNYAEGPMLLEKTKHLSPHMKAVLFAYGGLSIEDAARLHQFDLLPKKIEHFPLEIFEEVMVPFLRKKLEEHKAKSKV